MRFLTVLVVVARAGFAAAQVPTCPTEETSRTYLGRRFTYSETLNPEVTLDADGSRYLRARVRLAQPSLDSWIVTVRDHAARPVQFLTPASFGAAGADVWTARIPGTIATFSLETDGVAPIVTVKEKLVMDITARRTYYSILGRARRIEHLFQSDRRHRSLGDAVGFLMPSWRTRSWCCSGIMVAPDMMLTAWHCGGTGSDPEDPGLDQANYWNDLVQKETIIDLAWDGYGSSREYLVDSLVAGSRSLDFALLRVRPANGPTGVRVPALSALLPAKGHALRLVHHPGCEVKSLSRCASEGALDSDRVAHTCDSEGGSSGGPLFDDAGRLVALHYHGVDIDPETCERKDNVNKAVTVKSILDYLHKCAPAALASIKTVDWSRPALSQQITCGQ